MPEKPTCIKGLNGRLFAFSDNKIFRINPAGLYIEDIHEGIGCLNQSCAVSTEYGMFFVDRNAAYLHNGSSVKKLSTAIEQFNYQDNWSVALPDFIRQSMRIYNENLNNPNLVVKVSFEPKRNSFLIWGHDVKIIDGNTDFVGRVWAYSIDRQRWDYWEAPLHQGLLMKYNGDTSGMSTYVFTKGHKMVSYLEGDTQRNWDYTSKLFTLGMDTQEKILSRIKFSGGMLQTVSEPAENSDTLRLRTDSGNTYADLESKKDYYKIKSSAMLYTRDLCESDGGTFTSASEIELYIVTSVSGWFNEIDSDIVTMQLGIKNQAATDITFSAESTFWLEDTTGQFPSFNFCEPDGGDMASDITFDATTIYANLGQAPHIKVAPGSVWTGLTTYPGLLNTDGVSAGVTGSFLFSSTPGCIIGDTTYTSKVKSSKKVKQVQVQLWGQSKEMDAYGIIYRRKTVK